MSLSLSITRALQRPCWQMRFDKALEARYQRDIAEVRRRHLCISLSVAILVYAGFVVLDWFLLNPTFREILGLCLLVGFCGLGILLALQLLPARHPAREWLGILPSLLAYGPTLFPLDYADSQHRALWLATVPLLTLYTNSCIAPPLRQAVAHSGCAVLAIGLAVSVNQLQSMESALILTLAIATALFTLLSTLWMESARRQSYLLVLRDQLRNDELASANRLLERQSCTDPLTNVANRRVLMQRLSTALERTRQNPQALLVLMIDVDHFKAYNDHYGHPAGDRCLQQIANALGGQLQGNDCLARYGGEEFVILREETNLSDAAAFTQRLLEAVHHLALPHAAAATSASVSVSIGAIVDATGGAASEHLIEAADRQLYLAKRTGRDRCCLALLEAVA